MVSNKRSISTIAVYFFGFLLLLTNYVSCDGGKKVEVQWEYENSVKQCNNDNVCHLQLHMDQSVIVNLTISNLDENDVNASNSTIRIVSESDILHVPMEVSVKKTENGLWRATFSANAIFIGKTSMHVELIGKPDSEPAQSDNLDVVITRAERLIDKLFIISVATLVSILYINFGAALDLKKVKHVLRRPIGPAIAFACHFLFLPLASYVLGLLLFPNDAAMQLGLFFTGSSPAGGASNTWTVILGGNIDLSITMSTTSTLSAFLMTPLWIFTLGKTIFDRANMEVPYGQIASSVFSLIIPLVVGLLIQRYCPRVSRFLVRILKTCSSLLIIFIVVFAIVTNLYLFQLFTWQIFLGGLLLPWLGYFVGWLAAVIFRQDYEDRLAIAVEAGIQNTGISIFVLRHALQQPEADLTTVIPVSVAIMTPFPLIAFYLCLKCREWINRRRSRQFPAEIKECIRSQESGVY